MAGRRRGGADSRCPACGQRVHRHSAGHSVPFAVVADLVPLTPEQQAAVREPNRLIYCLRNSSRLTFATRHPPDCPHPHVTEHRCPTTDTLF